MQLWLLCWLNKKFYLIISKLSDLKPHAKAWSSGLSYYYLGTIFTKKAEHQHKSLSSSHFLAWKWWTFFFSLFLLLFPGFLLCFCFLEGAENSDDSAPNNNMNLCKLQINPKCGCLMQLQKFVAHKCAKDFYSCIKKGMLQSVDDRVELWKWFCSELSDRSLTLTTSVSSNLIWVTSTPPTCFLFFFCFFLKLPSSLPSSHCSAVLPEANGIIGDKGENILIVTTAAAQASLTHPGDHRCMKPGIISLTRNLTTFFVLFFSQTQCLFIKVTKVILTLCIWIKYRVHDRI